MPASADFNGSSHQLLYDNASAGPPFDISYPFCLVCWFNADVVTGGSKYPLSINDANDAGGSWVGIRINSSNLYISVTDSATTDLFSVGAVSASTWYFCVLEVNSTTDRKMYLNGAQYGSTATTSVDVLAAGDMDRSAVGDLNYNTTHFYFDGKVVHPQIYNQALSATEQALIMRNPFALPANLVWYPNMKVAGSVVGDYLDLSGKGYIPNGGTVPGTSDLGVPTYNPYTNI